LVIFEIEPHIFAHQAVYASHITGDDRPETAHPALLI
jgi:hypothetical protein